MGLPAGPVKFDQRIEQGTAVPKNFAYWANRPSGLLKKVIDHLDHCMLVAPHVVRWTNIQVGVHIQYGGVLFELSFEGSANKTKCAEKLSSFAHTTMCLAVQCVATLLPRRPRFNCPHLAVKLHSEPIVVVSTVAPALQLQRTSPDATLFSVTLLNNSIRVQVEMSTLILRLESSGQPLRWIDWQEAVILNARGRIAWSAGETEFTYWGGVNRSTGQRSSITVNSIIAVRGHGRQYTAGKIVPPLSNRELFLRDGNTCMYCGGQFHPHLLTRDHLTPLSRGGVDTWQNVVTACRSCNHAKGARTPEEAHMELLAVPYTPNRAEYLVLSNRRILADQMEFLRKRFRSGSRLAMS